MFRKFTIALLICLFAGLATAGETVVTLKTTQGDIMLRFFPDDAPEHVKNFIEHSKSGYYAGTIFHRVMPGFMIQGGDINSKDDDPANDGMGGYSYKGPGTLLDAEFNDRPHERGALSMARSQSPNSAGSQFFICHGAPSFLDGKYTVFGETIDGIEVVDKIVNMKRNARERPDVNQVIEEVKVAEWTTKRVEEAKKAMWDEVAAREKK
jgi:peptidyl-prolyl cis-trans isomerase B (cyclophilin B)